MALKRKGKLKSGVYVCLLILGKGSITVNSTMTFKKFLDDYFIPDYKSQVRKRTFDMTQSKFKRLSYFENMKLSDIQVPHVKQWQNSMFIGVV